VDDATMVVAMTSNGYNLKRSELIGDSHQLLGDIADK